MRPTPVRNTYRAFDACTLFCSDHFDVDGYGQNHDGYPVCGPRDNVFACGPCSCSAGEEQGYFTYQRSTTAPMTNIRCTSCVSAKFRSLEGFGSRDICQPSPAGTLSGHEGSTACGLSVAGHFVGEGASACPLCAVGPFASHESQTECESFEGQTACGACSVGHMASRNEQFCVHGMRRMTVLASATECSLCGVGSFADTQGSSARRRCSDVLNRSGLSASAWVTMAQQLWKGQWYCTNFEGATYVVNCSSTEGSWQTTGVECTQCGEGVVISGTLGTTTLVPCGVAAASLVSVGVLAT